MITNIPLNKLFPSARNVRRAIDTRADAQLAADIETRGLLQNLVVTRAGKPRGSFAVEAGGRRLRALQCLADEGKLASTHEICCLVLETASAAQEASLAENFQRLSMNPADECVAFQQLIEGGADVEGIARRFGVTTRFVEGRLRLAGLAPMIFEALGAGVISLEVAKAYAATPDRERQSFVFEQMSRGYGAAHPDSIRRMMTQATVSAGDRRAMFVGEDAYVAAGGRVEQDLFTDEGGARWLDIAILERLACEKMATAAADAAAEHGLAFVRPTLDTWIGHQQTAGLRRVPAASPPLSAEEAARLDTLEGEIAELAELLEHHAADEPARTAAEEKIRELKGCVQAIVNKPPILDDRLKANAGAFLMLDDSGRPRLDSTFYIEIVEEEPGAHADGLECPDAVDGRSGAPALSQRLVDELAMQRRDVLAVHVAADPGLALDLAIFLMIDRASFSAERCGSSLRAMPPADPAPGFEAPDMPATLARAEAESVLDLTWAEAPTRAERFDAFRALEEDARAAWLGHAVAATLEASLLLSGQRACAFHDHLGQLLGIEVARWWRPTGANYFDRIPKSLALAALEQVGGPALAARYSQAKKTELAQSCERIFSGEFIAEIEVKEAASAWVPDVMRFVELAAESDASAGDPPASNEAEMDSGSHAAGTDAPDREIEDAA